MNQESDPKDRAVAVIGMGCRFPGGIDSPDELWAFLCDAGDAIGDVPPDRWSLEEFHDAKHGKEGKIYTRRGGFLEDVRGFDPAFFGLSPREAKTMDPQQRLLLETAWEACEDGGIPPLRIRGSSTGVFVGLFVHDYENIHGQPSERRLFGPHSATGTSATIASNRISHCLDLRGPSLTVDTACSSSLVAVHLACRSLLSGETDLALAGGANTILRPEMSMMLCQAGMLSPSGLCRSFDSRADGYVRAEGVAMVVLKRLQDAERDGDPIRAVIRATAVNQDGGAHGMTVPSAEAQKRVIESALSEAGLPPSRIGFVEAHGTGTPVGDPVECEAIGSVYGRAAGRNGRCLIGSVKSNIGHTESAAGLAGLMKLVLMLQHGRFLPNRHFLEPNPAIDFDGLNLAVSTEVRPWEAAEEPRAGAVNSFGFGGTNAHAILEESHALRKEAAAPERQRGRVFPISARSQEALRAAISRLERFLSRNEVPLSDLAHTLACRREHHPHRVAFAADSIGQLRSLMSSFETGETRSYRRSPKPVPGPPGGIAFIYSGMGQDWPEMGRILFESEPEFRRVIEACDRELRKQTGEWRLVEELLAPASRSRLHRADIAQPCLFALQAALTGLLASVGIRPEFVLGHSAGEVASFHAAGALSLEEALRVSYVRGLLQQQCSGKGAMLAVGLPRGEVERRLGGRTRDVVIAAENSPSSVTLSGNRAALERLAGDFEREQVFARFVPVEIPYHSPAMDDLLEGLTTRLDGLSSRGAAFKLVSSVTGEFFENESADAAYWCRNVREPVLFRAGVETLIRNGAAVFVEIAAHPVLSPSIRENLEAAGKEDTVIATLRRHENDLGAFRGAVAALYGHGVEPDWDELNGPGRFCRIPTYPFQNESYWEESETSRATRLGHPVADAGGLMGPRVHPLLGARLNGPEFVWRGALELGRLPFLADHKIEETVVFPGAAGIEMLLAAARNASGENGPISLEKLEIGAPVILETGKEVPVETRVRGNEVSVDSSSSSGQWTRNFRASFTRWTDSVPAMPDPASLAGGLPDAMDREAVYRHFADIGLNYGREFQGVQWLQRGGGESMGEIHGDDPSSGTPSSTYGVHPSVLDACFQVAAILPEEGTFLPVGADRVTFLAPLHAPVFARAKLTSISPRVLRADILISNIAGDVVMSVEGLTCHRSDRDGSQFSNAETLLYSSEWIEAPLHEGLHPRIAPFFPSPRVLKDQLSGWIERDAEKHRRSRYYKEVGPDLDRLVTEYLLSAFHTLGIRFSVGERFSTESACGSLGIAAKHRKLFERFLGILAEDGYLKAFGTNGWTVARHPSPMDPAALWSRMLFSHAAYEAELLLLARFGERLPEILTDVLDPLEILFPQDSSIAEQFYRDSPTMAGCKRIAKEVVYRLVDSLPGGRVLKVLEVGGGTGSLASYLLPLFPEHRTEYHFTDLSLSFTVKAQQRFSKFPFVSYGAFDLEKEVGPQGLEGGSFDLILASDVVHATRDLRQSARRLLELLAPGGQLLMTEITHAPRWFDLVFGTLEGWWVFQDFNLRPSHPTVPFPKWEGLLKEVGFESVEGFSDPVASPLQTLILAQGPCLSDPGVPPGLSAPLSSAFTVFPDRGGFWRELAPLLPNATVLEVNWEGNEVRLRDLRDQAEPTGTVLSKDILFLSDLDYREEPASAAEMEEWTNRSTLHHLAALKALAEIEWREPPRLWWITAGAELVPGDTTLSLVQTTSRGLARVTASELAPMEVHRIDLGATPTKEIAPLLAELSAATDETEVVLRGPKRFISRLVRTRPLVSERAFRVSTRRSGNPESFPLVESKRIPPGAGEIEVQVAAAGINFKDLARNAGLVGESGEREDTPGLECAGTVIACGAGVKDLNPGDRVLGLARGTFSSHVTGDARFFVRMPERLSFAEGAALPVAFLSAWHSLVDLAGIEAGESALIHTASGGLGLAAIQVARLRGARILATAGSPEKRLFLQRLGIEYAGDSRSLAFVGEVRQLLGGDRLDVILNTLPSEFVEKSLGLLTPVKGRFIDVANLHSRGLLPLASLGKGVRFSAFDLETILSHEPERVREILGAIVTSIESGELHPLPFLSLSCTEASTAFSLMRRTQHIGKIVLTFDDEGHNLIADSTELKVKTEGTCLITGGLGGFGLAAARWIAECGFRRIVLLGRGGVATDSAEKAIAGIEQAGAQVKVEIADVADEDRMREVFRDIERSAFPLKGIVHAAMVLDDISLKRMSREQMTRVLRPKVVGGWILDRLARDCALDFFISFSSFSATVGPSDQGSYAAANTFLDSLALSRRLRGDAGCSVSWGAIGTVGYVSGNAQIADFFRRQGVFPIGLRQSWQILRHVIEERVPHLSAIAIDWGRFARYNPSIARNPRYSQLLGDDSSRGLPTEKEAGAALPVEPSKRLAALESLLTNIVGNLLGLSHDGISSDTPLADLGFDSLMAGELALRIRESTTVELPRMALLASGLDVATLATLIAERLADSTGEQRSSSGNHEDFDPDPVVDELEETEIDLLLGEILDSTK